MSGSPGDVRSGDSAQAAGGREGTPPTPKTQDIGRFRFGREVFLNRAFVFGAMELVESGQGLFFGGVMGVFESGGTIDSVKV